VVQLGDALGGGHQQRLPAAEVVRGRARRQVRPLLHRAVGQPVYARGRQQLDGVDPITRLAEPLSSYVSGRVALLGDAAHAMPPDLGQGAGQAFEDAAALTRHLTGAEPADVAQRLLSYDAERRPRANRLMRAASRQSRLTSQTGAAAWLRDVFLRAVPSRLATRQLAALWHA
jgi:2-polyprenyl-6-methoxyphenol hydroxylase-like FAD-dependent oxidoreductase